MPQYHPNTAPFLAIRFAQRFGISNPSPRYIDTAATAFRTGRHIDKASGLRYGTGEYGNLGALVAALLLDREARSVILDADPTYGSLFEPFLRLVRLMKSLEFRAKADRKYVDLVKHLIDLIGQEPHALPDVFSFFLPEFQPKGEKNLITAKSICFREENAHRLIFHRPCCKQRSSLPRSGSTNRTDDCEPAEWFSITT